MKKKSLILLIISVFLVLVSCTNNKTEAVNIFSGGETEYKIVTAEDASEDEQALAKELASLSGTPLEIVTDAEKETTYEILIGNTNRAATAEFMSTLSEGVTISAFQYIIAEKDGKLVILSDDDIGYIYALDYIKATYYNDGVLSVSRGLCDIKQVSWDLYYASDLYYDRLIAEADRDRFDEIRDQLENEANKYDENKDNSVTTVADVIAKYQRFNAAFDSTSFGEYIPAVFVEKNIYEVPTVYPDAGHPRVLFREKDISTLSANLTSAQNASQYKMYIALSNVTSTGQFETVSGSMKHNYSYDTVAKIEADAYRYIMERDSEDATVAQNAVIYGYEAIYAIKNAILTVDISTSLGDCARAYGQILYVTACVYDWCYDLMTELDKAQIIAGGVTILGKGLEVVRYDGSENLVPSSQDPVTDHGGEHQLLAQYFAFAIACYDEAPEIYELVGGRILNNYADYQNYFAASGTYWQGLYYSAFRAPASVMANILVKGMKDEDVELPFKYTEEMAITQTYRYRPDGYIFMAGDVGQNQGRGYDFVYDATYMFLTANLHGNSYLKSYAYKYSESFSNFYGTVVDTSLYKGSGGISAVQFLALNDPTVDYVYEGTAPLTHTNSFPYTNIFARSSNDDKNAYGLYMTMQNMFVSSHGHLDCGSFQISYNGSILASDSGGYLPWGSVHHMGYAMQTIAHNSILVYNPNLAGTTNAVYKNIIYSGGQSIYNIDASVAFKSLADYLAYVETNSRYDQCTSLGTVNVETEIDGEQVYLYSYMGGDMTNAYDTETVDEVTRYMFSVATGDEKCPYIFLTFDRIVSDDASYKKTALIHTEEEPTLNGDFAIVVNGDGKLVIQSVGFDTTYTLVGGKGNEFNVNGTNLPINETLYSSKAEFGWGRIEISPAEADLKNYMLTVMYVTDASNESLIKADELVFDNLAGAEIFGKTVLFSKDEKLLSKESSFTLNESGECFIAGVTAGRWTVTNGTETETVTVIDGENLITFTADEAGTYTITPAE